jgi:lipid A 3-O-deacylase
MVWYLSLEHIIKYLNNMKKNIKYSWLTLMIISITGTTSSAQDILPNAIGFRSSVSASQKYENNKQYEIYSIHELPWKWRPISDLVINVDLNSTIGAYNTREINGFIFSTGPGFTLRNVGSRYALDLGTRVAFLSDENLGKKDFGGKLNFISHVGVKIKLDINVIVGYRFEHMSNAGIYKYNPGINWHAIEFEYFL